MNSGSKLALYSISIFLLTNCKSIESNDDNVLYSSPNAPVTMSNCNIFKGTSFKYNLNHHTLESPDSQTYYLTQSTCRDFNIVQSPLTDSQERSDCNFYFRLRNGEFCGCAAQTRSHSLIVSDKNCFRTNSVTLQPLTSKDLETESNSLKGWTDNLKIKKAQFQIQSSTNTCKFLYFNSENLKVSLMIYRATGTNPQACQLLISEEKQFEFASNLSQAYSTLISHFSMRECEYDVSRYYYHCHIAEQQGSGANYIQDEYRKEKIMACFLPLGSSHLSKSKTLDGCKVDQPYYGKPNWQYIDFQN